MKMGKFRKSFFGGFNRSDVAKYIVALAEERNEYKARAERAEEELALKNAAAAAEEFCAEECAEDVCTEECAEEVCTEECAAPEEAPAEDERDDMEKILAEIRESIATVSAGIQQSIAVVREEIDRAAADTETAEEPEAAAEPAPVAAVECEAAARPAIRAEVSENVSRVLGMLECTEAHFALLEKTLKAIKNDVTDV